MNAEELFGLIGTGHKNALKVSNANSKFRKLVKKANDNGDCIINVDNGYYRPDPNDEHDVREFEHYIARELHRAREILYKRECLKEAWRKINADSQQ